MMLLLLLAGHALCDYPLQGDFLARGKNHRDPLPGVPFWQCLLAHSMIHAGMVAIVTGNIWFGVAEFAIHAITDFLRCNGAFSFNVDQFIHVFCKVLWFVLATG